MREKKQTHKKNGATTKQVRGSGCASEKRKNTRYTKKLSQKKSHLRPVGECWLPARIGLGRERDGFMRKVLAVPLERAERAEADAARARVHVAAALHVHREVLGSNPRSGVVEFGEKQGRGVEAHAEV